VTPARWLPRSLPTAWWSALTEARCAVATRSRESSAAVFADHKTATYVTKVRSVKALDADAALLHAVAGMVPPGGSELMPDRNAVQTVVVQRSDAGWSVALFQTTPAQFHGRPELTEALTAELADLLPHQ
jgi:hypothetical protein